MGWILNREKSHAEQIQLADKQYLFHDIKQAHKEWVLAQIQLDWALEKDQIDYAVYALEAAEKRYEMLLRLAKQTKWDNGPFLLEMEG
jgi:hypothetical protein